MSLSRKRCSIHSFSSRHENESRPFTLIFSAPKRQKRAFPFACKGCVRLREAEMQRLSPIHRWVVSKRTHEVYTTSLSRGPQNVVLRTRHSIVGQARRGSKPQASEAKSVFNTGVGPIRGNWALLQFILPQIQPPHIADSKNATRHHLPLSAKDGPIAGRPGAKRQSAMVHSPHREAGKKPTNQEVPTPRLKVATASLSLEGVWVWSQNRRGPIGSVRVRFGGREWLLRP